MRKLIKIIITLLLAAVLLCSCADAGRPAADDTTEDITPTPPAEDVRRFDPIGAVDHCVVEPDERAAMSAADREAFRVLMDAMLARRDEVVLDADEDRIAFLLELLHESPYGFFVSSATAEGSAVSLDYAYPADEQAAMQSLMDSELFAIANASADPNDNELDVILKIYHAVGERLIYDTTRDDNKQLGSPLFDYPGDEVYKTLRDGKGLCYGFAYIFRYALLQRGIDSWCVYGECRAHDMGHEWVVFRYDGEYFHCDPAWDRAADLSTKLMHFGKTDSEREADTLVPRDFAEYHLPEGGEVTCTDERFAIFRGTVSFTYVGGHTYRLTDRDENTQIFDSESFTINEELGMRN